MTGFKYPYTCPAIDNCLTKVEILISDALDIQDNRTVKEVLIREITAVIESIRTENENMRLAAEEQVLDLQGQISTLKAQIELNRSESV